MPDAKPPRSPIALKRKLARVEKHARRRDVDEFHRGIIYGPQQALAWALRDNAAAPSKVMPAPAARRRSS